MGIELQVMPLALSWMVKHCAMFHLNASSTDNGNDVFALSICTKHCLPSFGVDGDVNSCDPKAKQRKQME